MTDLIKYAVKEGIATLILNRLDKRNAMNNEMHADFGIAVQAATEDSFAGVLIITGSFGSFCAVDFSH